MHCNVTGGIPPPSISWLRNGFPLEISERMQLLSGGKILQIIQSQVSFDITIVITYFRGLWYFEKEEDDSTTVLFSHYIAT